MPELFVGDLLITEVSEGIPKCSNIKKLIAQEPQELFLFDNWFYFTDILFRKSVSGKVMMAQILPLCIS